MASRKKMWAFKSSLMTSYDGPCRLAIDFLKELKKNENPEVKNLSIRVTVPWAPHTVSINKIDGPVTTDFARERIKRSLQYSEPMSDKISQWCFGV